MVADRVVLVLSLFFFGLLHVTLCLPLLRESPEASRHTRSAVPQYPGLSRQDGPLLNQWDLPTLGEDDYPSTYVRSRPEFQRERRFMEDLVRPRPDSHKAHRRTLDYPVSKRNSNEEANIPTMGLGVLSDMRKFFTDLRVNLDSVEEAAALSHEHGNLRSGSLDPADFLAFLARHGARSGEAASGESDLPRNPTHMRRLMFGYNHDDQPYAHSGLGK